MQAAYLLVGTNWVDKPSASLIQVAEATVSLFQRRRCLTRLYSLIGKGAPAKEPIAMTIINLNKYRKQRKRSEEQRRSAENRVRFGLDKDKRMRELQEREQARKDIEGKRLD